MFTPWRLNFRAWSSGGRSFFMLVLSLPICGQVKWGWISSKPRPMCNARLTAVRELRKYERKKVNTQTSDCFATIFDVLHQKASSVKTQVPKEYGCVSQYMLKTASNLRRSAGWSSLWQCRLLKGCCQRDGVQRLKSAKSQGPHLVLRLLQGKKSERTFCKWLLNQSLHSELYACGSELQLLWDTPGSWEPEQKSSHVLHFLRYDFKSCQPQLKWVWMTM